MSLRLPIEDLLEKIVQEFDVIGIGGMTTVYYYKLLSLKLKERYRAADHRRRERLFGLSRSRACQHRR